MAKDPAFLFYPGDYLRDTQCLSEPVQVAYDRIMCEHMRNICISQAQLNFFTKKLSAEQKEELLMVISKTKSGYQIDWVVESINKRKAYSESRRENRSSKKIISNDNISSSYDSHMENEDVNEDIVVKKENMVVQEMMKIWLLHKPRYPKEVDKDFPALLALAYKIADYKGWKRADIIGKKEKDVLASWDKIVKYVISDAWYQTKSISVINNQWQSLVAQMDAKKNGQVKETDPTKIKLTL